MQDTLQCTFCSFTMPDRPFKINTCGSSAGVTCYANEESYLTHAVSKIFHVCHRTIQNLLNRQTSHENRKTAPGFQSCGHNPLSPLYSGSDQFQCLCGLMRYKNMWLCKEFWYGRFSEVLPLKHYTPQDLLSPGHQNHHLMLRSYSLCCNVPACELGGKGFSYATQESVNRL